MSDLKTFRHPPKRASKLGVLVGVGIACVIAGMPLMNKKVYQREQEVAAMRDDKYGGDIGQFKDDARAQRMSIRRGPAIDVSD